MRAITLDRVLAGLLGAAILTLWVPDRWAYTAVQLGIFLIAVCSILRHGPRPHPIVLLLSAATLWGGAQLVAGWTAYPHATFDATLNWLTWTAAAYAAATVFSEADHARVRQWLSMFGGVLAALSLVARYTSPERVFWLFRIDVPPPYMGPFVYENQYAAFIEMLLPCAVLAAVEGSFAATTLAAVMIASVFVSGSVAGAVIVVVEAAVVMALAAWQTGVPARRLAGAAAMLAVLVATVGTVAGWDVLWKDLMRRQPYETRGMLASSTIEMTTARPWTGFGLGTWSTVYPAYARFDDGLFDNQAHNDWLQWAAEGGLPFAAIMAAIALLLVRPGVRSIWGVGLLFVLAHSAVEFHFQQRPGFGCLFFALAGALSGQRRLTAPAESADVPSPSSSGRVPGPAPPVRGS